MVVFLASNIAIWHGIGETELICRELPVSVDHLSLRPFTMHFATFTQRYRSTYHCSAHVMTGMLLMHRRRCPFHVVGGVVHRHKVSLALAIIGGRGKRAESEATGSFLAALIYPLSSRMGIRLWDFHFMRKSTQPFVSIDDGLLRVGE